MNATKKSVLDSTVDCELDTGSREITLQANVGDVITMIYRLAREPFILCESSTTCGMSRINHRAQKLLPTTSRKSLPEVPGGDGRGRAELVCNLVFPLALDSRRRDEEERRFSALFSQIPREPSDISPLDCVRRTASPPGVHTYQRGTDTWSESRAIQLGDLRR